MKTFDPASEYCPDDSRCAYCNADLEQSNESEWVNNGYCGPVCCAMHSLNLAKFPDDDLHGATRQLFAFALAEVCARANSKS